jgi:hypothetical protein
MERFEIDELTVVSLPLKPRICFRLDRKVTRLIFKTLKGNGELDLKKIEEIEVNVLIGNFIDALDSLDDKEYMDIILELLSSTQVEKDKKVVQISSEDSFDIAFKDVQIMTIYKVLVKILQMNKFTPFVLAEEMGFSEVIPGLAGNQTQETSS